MTTFSSKLTKWCLKYNYIEEENNEVVKYGIQLFIEAVSKSLVIIAIGVWHGSGKESFIALFCFSLLRKYTGGIHFRSNCGCFLGSFLICELAKLIAKITRYSLLLADLNLFAGIFAICMYAPADMYCKVKIDSCLRKKIKIKGVLVICFLHMISLLIKKESYKNIIIYSMSIQLLTIFPCYKKFVEGGS